VTGKTALVLGATGLVGKALLNHLNTGGYYTKIKILTRRSITNISDYPRLEAIELSDFNDLPSIADRLNARDVFCALGTTMKKAGSKAAFYAVDFIYPYALAQLALQQGAHHFLVITASGASPASRIFYNRVKGELEQALERLDYPRMTILRPSLLLGKRDDFRLGEFAGQTLGQMLSGILPARLKPIAADALAQAMVKTARAEGSGTQILESEVIRQIAG